MSIRLRILAELLSDDLSEKGVIAQDDELLSLTLTITNHAGTKQTVIIAESFTGNGWEIDGELLI
ncbi:MAG: hypothetical protein Q7U66_01820 [Methylobacter sp.]|nr:hypothetical protein [Methylobacter sp.]